MQLSPRRWASTECGYYRCTAKDRLPVLTHMHPLISQTHFVLRFYNSNSKYGYDPRKHNNKCVWKAFGCTFHCFYGAVSIGTWCKTKWDFFRNRSTPNSALDEKGVEKEIELSFSQGHAWEQNSSYKAECGEVNFYWQKYVGQVDIRLLARNRSTLPFERNIAL